MALRRKMLETLSGMAKQQEERHSNRLQIIEPTQQELLSDYHISQIPELKEKKSRKKAQDKAMEEQAYLKYMLENPKLLEDITLKKAKKKTEKERIRSDEIERPKREAKLANEKEEELRRQQEALIPDRKKLDDVMDAYVQNDKELALLAKQHPEETAEAIADAIIGVAGDEYLTMMAMHAKDLADKQQLKIQSQKLASVYDGIDETGAEEGEEEDAEEDEGGDIDYISQQLKDTPTELLKANAMKHLYATDATNDYSKNMELLRNEDATLSTRQAVALQLAMDTARKEGTHPKNLPKKAKKVVTRAIVSSPARQETIKEALARSTTASAPGSVRSPTAPAPRFAHVASRPRAGISARVGPKHKVGKS